MAVRVSLGASRGRLLGQLLTETVLLAGISGAVALVTVVCLKGSLLHLAPSDLPRLNEVSLSPAILLFAFFLSLFTGVIFGLVPALQSARSNQTVSLREGSRGSGTSKRQLRLSRLLVGSEIALSLVLLIGAGLLVRSFWQLLEVHPGFDSRHLLTAKLWLAVPNNPNQNPYLSVEKRAAFHQEVLRRISAIPGIEQAALGTASSLPMDVTHTQSPFLLETPGFDAQRVPVAEIAAVTPAYFSVLKTPLISGRVFSDSDNTKGDPVALIDETLARRYWPSSPSDAIGQRLQIGLPGNRPAGTAVPWVTIIGIVGNIKSDGFDAANAPHIYRPLYQRPSFSDVVFLRTSADPASLAEPIRAAVQAVDPTIPVFSVRTMDFVVSAFLAERRFALELLGVFAVTALLLASVGIYGVMAFTFSRRTNEIGIRVAMGAQRLDIFKLAFSEGALIVGFGVVAGLLGSWALTRFLQTMLFNVKATDPATYAAIGALLTFVTLLACLIPARRAARVDPLVALRHE